MTTETKIDFEKPQRFRLLRGSYIQSKYPGVDRMVRRMEDIPRAKRGLEHLPFAKLEEIASIVGCPVEKEDDEQSLIQRLREDKVYHCKDPKNNIITTTINLEMRYGRDKFQNLDAFSSSDPNYAATQERLAILEAENAQLRAQLGKPVNDPAADEIDFNKLEKMNLKALKSYATTEIGVEGIDDTWSKEEVLNAIRSAVTSVE